MVDVFNASTGRNSATVDKFPNRVMTGTYDAGFHTRLMAKDLRLYVDTVRAAGTARRRREASSLTSGNAPMPRFPDSDFTEIWRFVSQSV